MVDPSMYNQRLSKVLQAEPFTNEEAFEREDLEPLDEDNVMITERENDEYESDFSESEQDERDEFTLNLNLTDSEEGGPSYTASARLPDIDEFSSFEM